VVDRGALEKHCGREVTVGSNPTLSASKKGHQAGVLFGYQSAAGPKKRQIIARYVNFA
jgi:hypothetical protein